MENFILLTKYSGKIVGPIAKLLGYIMEFIFNLLSKANIYNVGLSIILFTLIVKLILLPLTVKQQKFSKMSAIMNPELQAIQKKYKNKKDQDSLMKMQDETKEVYEKYGVSPSGSCLQLIIQMPILLALYQVIRRVPAYISQIKEYYISIVDVIARNNLYQSVSDISSSSTASLDGIATATDLAGLTDSARDSIIDVLSQFSSSNWSDFKGLTMSASDLTIVNDAVAQINHANTFLGINLGETPSAALGIALIIPVLAGLTQWLSIKISNASVPASNNNEENPMGGSMKMMNIMMPLISLFFCFSFQAGIGLYWVVGAVYQILFQLGINAYFNRIDMNKIMQKNMEKANKKREKKGLPQKNIADKANIKKNYNEVLREAQEKARKQEEEDKKREKEHKTEVQKKNSYKAGSISEKANMVKKFDEANRKK